MQKDAARMVRRKVMMGQALTNDFLNSAHRGVHINFPAPRQPTGGTPSLQATSTEQTTDSVPEELMLELVKNDRNPMKQYASPFIEKVLMFIERHKIPFEHIDVWVPSFVPSVGPDPSDSQMSGEAKQKCRLCFAGCGTAESKIPAGGGEPVPMSPEEQFNLQSFGDYSQKFSFDVRCGLPGRVYSSGVASWEQGIQSAPSTQFERSGGATQWGIETVLGLPIQSPNVGRIVVLFYSIFDRPRNMQVVNRLSVDLQKVKIVYVG